MFCSLHFTLQSNKDNKHEQAKQELFCLFAV